MGVFIRKTNSQPLAFAQAPLLSTRILFNPGVPPPRVAGKILEVGHGGRPLRMDLDRFKRILKPPVEYYGVDILGGDSLKRPNRSLDLRTEAAVRLFEAVFQNVPNVNLLGGDVKNLAFPSNMFVEVHAHCFFNNMLLTSFDIQILVQMIRCLAVNGSLILTGRESRYFNERQSTLELALLQFGLVLENDGLESTLYGPAIASTLAETDYVFVVTKKGIVSHEFFDDVFKQFGSFSFMR